MVSSTVNLKHSASCLPTRRTIAFICPRCRRRYGDPMYHGPAGHAPPQMCFDCWAAEWAEMAQVIARGGRWQSVDAALWLMCQGFSQAEVAELIGVHRGQVFAWIREVRRNPRLAPDWLRRPARSRDPRSMVQMS